MSDIQPPPEEHMDLLRQQNALLRRQIRENNHVGWLMYRGMWLGLGTAIGATVVVSLVVMALKPLQDIKPIQPAIEKLVERLDRLDRLGVKPDAPQGARMTPEPAVSPASPPSTPPRNPPLDPDGTPRPGSDQSSP